MAMVAERSVLLLVDLQQRLHPAIDDGPQVLAACVWLTEVAGRLGVPVVCTEQYPRGLGPTVPELRRLLPDGAVIEKTHFSAVAEGNLPQVAGGERPQVVVAGTEAHVCVLQTVLGLRRLGHEVRLVRDAVGSRRRADRRAALERAASYGAELVTSEMVAFEWLATSDHPRFRDVLQLVK